MTQTPTFADITTMAVGGSIERFIEPDSRVGVIEAVEDADSKGLNLLVIGGGSNTVVSDDKFHGIVVRDARNVITVPDEVAPVEHGERVVHINAEAGANWDDVVQFAIKLGLVGIEALSGIPGTVGASVVQNIGAYGQEVGTSVDSVEVWDRVEKRVTELSAHDMQFGYRTSLLKQTAQPHYQATLPNDAPQCGPTPRYVVLSVTLKLTHNPDPTITSSQLAHALGVEVGTAMPTVVVRERILAIRAAKGMLEDPMRYASPWMSRTKQEVHIIEDIERFQALAGTAEQKNPANRHSSGSFFTNPILSAEQATTLPEDAPRYPVANAYEIKTSAAWLIEHAGFAKGFALPDSHAGLSQLHTLALTNRGGASAHELMQLAGHIVRGVHEAYGITLVPEPVFVGVSLE